MAKVVVYMVKQFVGIFIKLFENFLLIFFENYFDCFSVSVLFMDWIKQKRMINI